MTANTKQYGGTHYKRMAIQPWDFIVSNNMGYLDGTAVKYLARWKDKGGVEDLKKAIHFIEKLIEVENERKEEWKAPQADVPTDDGDYCSEFDYEHHRSECYVPDFQSNGEEGS